MKLTTKWNQIHPLRMINRIPSLKADALVQSKAWHRAMLRRTNPLEHSQAQHTLKRITRVKQQNMPYM
jgi:hypothetical protein